MTKKRFTTNGYKIYDTFHDGMCCLVNEVEVEEIVTIMNNLDTKARERGKHLSKLQKENEQLKQKIIELDSENEKLWDTCNHTLQFARKEDITIKRDDKGHYKIYSKNVIPHDSPIISINAPSILFNDYILNHIIEAIEKIPPVQEKEVVTDD